MTKSVSRIYLRFFVAQHVLVRKKEISDITIYILTF